MNKLSNLLLLGSLLLLTTGAAPKQYRRDLNGNISIYENNLRIQTLRKSPLGYRSYDRYGRYEETYYGKYSTKRHNSGRYLMPSNRSEYNQPTVNGSYYW